MVSNVISIGFLLEPGAVTKVQVVLEGDGGEYAADLPAEQAQFMAFLWKNDWECQLQSQIVGLDPYFTFAPKAAG
jgi:hypothetical protein